MECRKFIKGKDCAAVGQIPGLVRYTMSYCKDIMMCRFEQKKGTEVSLHTHAAVQNGYVLEGKLKFFSEDGSFVTAEKGDSYTFDSMEPHGSVCIEDAVFIETFRLCVKNMYKEEPWTLR